MSAEKISREGRGVVGAGPEVAGEALGLVSSRAGLAEAVGCRLIGVATPPLEVVWGDSVSYVFCSATFWGEGSEPMFFDQFMRRARPLIEERWGAELADRVIRDACACYPRIASGLPDIGGRHNIFTPVITINGWLIALHDGMKRNGKSAEDTIAVAFALTDAVLRSLPVRFLKRVGRLAFAAPARRLFRRQAARSQEKRYPADFVYEIEETDEGEVSFVFSECAVNKLYDAQGLTDLKPYCNFFDVTYSRLMDMGVDAHETIGLGCEHCALRFKHGRATEVPAALRPIIRDAQA